ncbi:MAG: coproporphyrinogen dehydrogenase HemZ [Anaerofustis sp.]
MIELTIKADAVIEATIREITSVYEAFCGDLSIVVEPHDGGMTASAGEQCAFAPTTEHSPTKTAKSAVYLLLQRITGIDLPWGSMTGVKPLNKYEQLLEQGMSEEEATEYFRFTLHVSRQKTDLIAETARVQKPFLVPDVNTVGLYVHVPLCVSKCTYCSFPSRVTAQGSELCEGYLQALTKELFALGETAEQNGIRFDTVYVGGGTPSVFSEDQTARLMRAIRHIADCRELTFEAGRADTVSEEKLRILKEFGVSRISLNPQTMNDRTLAAINRSATVSDFLKCYEQARRIGFEVINCDLILGLEDETEDDFAHSLDAVAALAPENITLHTLCKKRSSDADLETIRESNVNVSAFHDTARAFLGQRGYRPYYLYKQKYAISASENAGYAMPSTECVYNIRMMGQKQSIYAAGAGSSTKLLNAEGNYRNVYNIKEVPQYIEKIDGIIEKKQREIRKK